MRNSVIGDIYSPLGIVEARMLQPILSIVIENVSINSTLNNLYQS